MTRLTTIHPDAATGATAEVFAQIKKKVGRVPNAYATIGTHSPEAMSAALAFDAAVAASTLSKPDIEIIKLVVSEHAGCDYCVAARTLTGKLAGLTPGQMKQARAGVPTGDAKRDSLVSYVSTLVNTRGTVPAAVVDAIRVAGFTERQVIEINLAIASITFSNLVNRVNDTILDFPAVD